MIGIGGIGMSALARYYKSQNFQVTGSNMGEATDLISDLVKEGIYVVCGEHKEENVPKDSDLIIYTVAISSDNLELVTAHHIANTSEKKVRILTYAEALGEMGSKKRVIAVCGSHGKTTTTAMTYFALREAGLDPSVIVGSLININGKKTNYIASENTESEWLIIEACEYKRSFMNYNPEIILVTNIDNDHLDYFKDLEDIKNTFQEFVSKLDKNTNLELFENNKKLNKLIIHNEQDYLNLNIFSNKVNADQVELSTIDLSVPGLHNRKNAQLVLALSNVLGLDNQKIRTGLKRFMGTWRRQEYKGKYFKMDFYDDYAHHPSEIKATLQAFKEKYNQGDENKKIVAVFQPHLYSRTKILFDDFVNSFSDADQVIVLPIYAAREKFDDSIDSQMLVREMQNKYQDKSVTFIKVENNNFNILRDYLEIISSENKVIITMGAGDIYGLYDIM
jgi:UDP-N-acetylmuramate--alanine ligase